MENEMVQLEGLTILPRQPLQPPYGMNFREWFDYKKGLETKRSLVRSQVKRIAKNGVNQSQGYRYAEASDIYDQINDAMHDAKLGFAAELLREEVITAKGGAPINKVYLLITWTDLDNGYFEQQEIAGTGLDYGDKGIYKAYTGAAKYSLVLNFLIPTGDDPARGPMDPEKDVKKEPQEGTGGPQPSGGTNRGGNQNNGNKAGNTRANEGKRKEEQPPNTLAPIPNNPPADPSTPKPEPISKEQIEYIKKRLVDLVDFENQPAAKTKAKEATYTALAVKLKIRSLDEKGLDALNADQGKTAMAELDQWYEKKKEIKRKLEETTPEQGKPPVDPAEPEATKTEGEEK